MNHPKSVSETELFFRQWLRSPKAIGSVKPSSRALARAIAAEVAWRPGQTVIELGGGTGAVTQGLIDHGLPRESLLVVEIDAAMCEFLRRRLPGVKVVNGDATRLNEILEEQGVTDVGTVICGIPMVGMPLEFQRKIMEQCFLAGPEGAAVIQFSYSPVSPIKSKKLGIEAKIARFVPYNLPPAFVWRFSRPSGKRRADGHR
jgi:phosphatidylethanolamine/phosphatidyl-N-methylethanolamine N-methyltransferase